MYNNHFIIDVNTLFLLTLFVCFFLLLRRSDSPEAAAGADHLHPLSARRPGVSVRKDPVPGHLHAGGGGAEDQPAGVQSPGENRDSDKTLNTNLPGPTFNSV